MAPGGDAGAPGSVAAPHTAAARAFAVLAWTLRIVETAGRTEPAIDPVRP